MDARICYAALIAGLSAYPAFAGTTTNLNLQIYYDLGPGPMNLAAGGAAIEYQAADSQPAPSATGTIEYPADPVAHISSTLHVWAKPALQLAASAIVSAYTPAPAPPPGSSLPANFTVDEGGTGANTAAGARANLGAAASGQNNDITGLGAVTSLTVGGSTGGSFWPGWRGGTADLVTLRDRVLIGKATDAYLGVIATSAVLPWPNTGLDYLETRSSLLALNEHGLTSATFLANSSYANVNDPAFYSVGGATIADSGDGTQGTYNNVLFVGGAGTLQQGNVTVGAGRNVTSIVWHGADGSGYKIGDVLTAVHVAGLPTTVTATVTRVNAPATIAAAFVGNNSAVNPNYRNPLWVTYLEGDGQLGSGNTTLMEADLGNSGYIVDRNPYTTGIKYSDGQTDGITINSGGSANGQNPSGYNNPVSNLLSFGNAGGRGAMEVIDVESNSAFSDPNPLYWVGGVPSANAKGYTAMAMPQLYKLAWYVSSPGFTVSGNIAAFDTLVGGTGGPTGPTTYSNVPLTGGAGTGAIAQTITVAGGAVTAVLMDIHFPGVGFGVGDVLTADPALIGGTTGFSFRVSTLAQVDQSNMGAYIQSNINAAGDVNGITFTNNGTEFSGGALFDPQESTPTFLSLGSKVPAFQVQGKGSIGGTQALFAAYGNTGNGLGVSQYYITRNTSVLPGAAVGTFDSYNWNLWVDTGLSANKVASMQFSMNGTATDGVIVTLDNANLVGGSGGVAGPTTYTGVALTGGHGTGAAATIIVSGGHVTSVVPTSFGVNYQVGDSLSALASAIGGGITGFSIPVLTNKGYAPGNIQFQTADLNGNMLPAWNMNSNQNVNAPGGSVQDSYTGAWVSISATGHAVFQSSLTKGSMWGGRGSTYDLQLVDYNGDPALSIPTGTTVIQLTSTTVSSLPTCNAGATGDVGFVTDASAPTYNATLTGGSTTKIKAVCNGANWVAG